MPRSKARKLYWPKAIDRVLQAQKTNPKAGFTINEKNKASDWPDCACGVQSKAIDRETDDWGNPTGAPTDHKLFRLGCSFSSAIHRNKPAKAKEILDAIEARAAELITAKAKEFTRKAALLQKQADRILAELD